MGYVRQRRIIKLVFEDEEFEGLVVRARSITLGQLRTIEQSDENTDSADLMLQTFADSLVEWNLEEEQADGSTTPVPMTFDGLLSQEPDFVRLMVDNWIAGVTGVQGPLGRPSNGGNKLEALSNLMEPLSESQAS